MEEQPDAIETDAFDMDEARLQKLRQLSRDLYARCIGSGLDINDVVIFRVFKMRAGLAALRFYDATDKFERDEAVEQLARDLYIRFVGKDLTEPDKGYFKYFAEIAWQAARIYYHDDVVGGDSDRIMPANERYGTTGTGERHECIACPSGRAWSETSRTGDRTMTPGVQFLVIGAVFGFLLPFAYQGACWGLWELVRHDQSAYTRLWWVMMGFVAFAAYHIVRFFRGYCKDYWSEYYEDRTRWKEY